jgi:protein-tyrosine-phosphatase
VKWDNHFDDQDRYQKGAHRIVHHPDQLAAVLAELSPFDCGVIAQQLVPGRGVGAFFLRHAGRIVLRFAHRRLHEVPWTGGVSSLCRMSDDPAVLEAGQRLLDHIDYQGVAMVEFRMQPGEPPRLLEINGRLWGSIGLALKAGADFPRAMVECHLRGATGVVQPNLSIKLRWRRLPLELDHVRSVLFKPAGPPHRSPSRPHAVASLLWHSVDPHTKSDLYWPEDRRTSVLAYWRLLRAELSTAKQWLFQQSRQRRERSTLTQLVRQSESLLQASTAHPPESIVFVCYGNICRSPYAEARWNDWRARHPALPPCQSAGFHRNEHRCTPARFQSAARHRGVELQQHRSKLLSREMVEAADWIVAMDLANLQHLRTEFPFAMPKTLLLGVCDDPRCPVIPDPYDQPIGAGGDAYSRIDAALGVLAIHLGGPGSGAPPPTSVNGRPLSGRTATTTCNGDLTSDR